MNAQGAASKPATALLDEAARGSRRAADELLPLVYEELRRLAEARLRREGPENTLQPTALVHEAFVRLVGKQQTDWEGRAHFFFAAARAMRDILVERARRRSSRRRAQHRRDVDARRITTALETSDEDLLALDSTLQQLGEVDSRAHQVVMLRYFAGLNREQAAEALGVTPRTIDRDWRFARAWLHERLSADAGDRRAPGHD